MEIWKIFANLFGPYYSTFVVFVVSFCLLLGSLTVSWTSTVLVKLSGTDDNPLRRHITPEESDLLGSLLFAGAAIGPLLFISSVEQFGRKRTLLLTTITLPIIFGTLAVAENIEIYFICRVLTGFNFGVMCSLQPVYVSEISTSKQRSVLMSFSTSFLILGNLASYTVGNVLSLFYFNSFIAVILLILFFTIAFCCPESPYYVMRTEGKEKTEEMLRQIRQTSDIREELLEVVDTIENEVRTSYLEIFMSIKNVKLFILATAILLFQELSGMIVLITYVQQIFEETKVPLSTYQCSVIMTCIQFATSFLTPVLLKCNLVSRKSLLMFAFIGLAVCNFSIGCYFHFGRHLSYLNWLPLVLIIALVAVYNCGVDPIPWMLVSEIYPMNIKSVGSALSTSLFILSAFPLLYSFNKFSLQYIFLACCCFNICGLIFVKYFIIDTESKSLREIHKVLSQSTM